MASETLKNSNKLLFLVLFTYISFKVIQGQMQPIFQQFETIFCQSVLKNHYFLENTLCSWMSRNKWKLCANFFSLLNIFSKVLAALNLQIQVFDILEFCDTYQKAANLALQWILAARVNYIECFEVWFSRIL